MTTAKRASDFRPTSKRFKIAQLAENGLSKRETYNELRPLVESGLMVFAANVGGSRVAKPLAEQLQELKNEIGRVYAILGRAATPDFDSPDTPADDVDTTPEPDTTPDTTPEPDTDNADDDDDTEPKPEAKGKGRVKDELRKFLAEVRRLRAFCKMKADMSKPVDFLSMRPVQAASKLIPAGIPADALIAAMTINWPQDTKNEAGVKPFDFVALSQEIMAERGLIGKLDSKGDPFHNLFGYALVLAENRQPIMLVGPHGTGKSHIAQQLSDYLAVDYGETPMTTGATRGDLLGRFTASPDRPFIAARFDEIYGGGGVFNFEEIDASDPGMLIVLNNALATKRFYNSNSGENVSRHEDFIAVSTANTYGTGATKDYNARERQDAATLDRWRMGRIWVELDENVEEKLLYNLG
jgi:AAA domain (dynein-related subfamily)